MTICIVCGIRLNSICQALNNYSSLYASDVFWYKPERNAVSQRHVVYFRTVAGRFIRG